MEMLNLEGFESRGFVEPRGFYFWEMKEESQIYLALKIHSGLKINPPPPL